MPFSELGQIDRPPVVEIEDLATPGGRCPACGEPLFPWLEVDGDAGAARLSHVLDRCENCGLATERGDSGEGLAALVEDLAKRARSAEGRGEAEITLPNGHSWQASLGAEGWAGIHLPEVPEVLTPKALELLLEHEGLETSRVSYPVAAGMAQLMQTLLNLITFNRDFARRAISGDLKPAEARRGGLGYGIDALATVLTAVPVAALSVVIESAAVLARRGGLLRVSVRAR